MQIHSSVAEDLCAYGALSSQLVDLGQDDDPRVLSYLDLQSGGPGWRPPTVVESNGQPALHVFDGRDHFTPAELDKWCWRVALRGDGAWLGVIEPGRLRVFRADSEEEGIRAVEIRNATSGQFFLPALLTDVRASQNELARRGFLAGLLERSADKASEYGLSQSDALSLIGRGLFWRFLLDRGMLNGMSPSDVCAAATTWEECLDNKRRAIKTFAWLDDTFNGGLLPFDAPLMQFRNELFSEVLGNIAHGATAEGQLRLPSDWRDINFAHIPVGLLSEVYEALANNIDRDAARRSSVHYTPAHLTDFVVRQAFAQLPQALRPSVLDPAAGAGVFLVTAFRHLVAREWVSQGVRPDRKSIRRILQSQLTGFDVDAKALRLAELALYLSALELDPKPRPLNELRFAALRDTVLFCLPAAEGGSLGPVEPRFLGRFDVVLGNPPWTAVPGAANDKKSWVAHSKSVVEQRLGAERARDFDLPDVNPDIPFLWRAMQWARPNGRIALILHARWLFSVSDRGQRARQEIFQAIKVTGLLNGAALRKTNVWPNVTAPWCLVFAENAPATGDQGAAFHFISPVLDLADESQQTRVRFDWQDAQTVAVTELLERPWALKERFRGNRMASQALAVLQQRGMRMGSCLKDVLGIEFKNGYQVGGMKGKQKSAVAFHGLPDTKSAGDLGFVVDTAKLSLFARPTLLFTRDRRIYRAPLLLLRKAIVVDRLQARVSRADMDVMYHESFHGLSFAGVANAGEWCRYLQLILQSGMMVFVELLMDALYGVERETIYMESLDFIPLIPLEQLKIEERKKIISLSDRMSSGLTPKLDFEVNEFVFDTFDLPPIYREAIRDTLSTGLPTKRCKERALNPATDKEREEFCEVLEQSLQNVASASGFTATVRPRLELNLMPWRLLEVFVSESVEPMSPAVPLHDFLETADANGASLVVHQVDPNSWVIGILERYFLWTPTRARLLASDLLAEFGRG